MATSTREKTPAASAVASATPRYAGLDGLRAIAVLTVIVFHLFPGVMPGGFLGVDIFFVISGFLITSLLLSEHAHSGRIRLTHFWRRRARRLLPALAVLALVCCSAAWIIGGDLLVGLGRQLLGAATFSTNWLSIAAEHSYFDESTPELFRNLWSLAVEEQFYLAWPLAVLGLLLIPRRWARVAIVGMLAVASAIGMWVLLGADATRVYYGTDTHSFGLAIGAVLALISIRWSRRPEDWRPATRTALSIIGTVAVVGLVAAAFVLTADGEFSYRGGLAVVAALSTLAILAGIIPGSVLGRVLDLQPMRWIGERSYGLYLWHWPIYVLAAELLAELSMTDVGGWLVGAIALIITAAASALSYRFVEQPIRRHGFRATLRALRTWNTSRLRMFRVATVGILSLTLVATTVVAVASDPGQGSVQAQIEAGQRAVQERAQAEHPEPEPVEGEPAEPAPLPGGDQISAIGDSVMLASARELQNAFPGIQIDAVVSRQLSQAPGIVERMKKKGTLRPTVLIGLGTNGPIDTKALLRLRDLAGSDHQIVLVNVYAPRWWTDGVNKGLTGFAQQYRNVELANWRDSISGHLNLLARDRIHPGDAGGRIYAGAVRDALQRLSELPPLLSPREYGLAPLPS